MSNCVLLPFSTWLSNALWRTSHYSVSCKQIVSHHTVTECAHINRNSSARSLTDVYLTGSHAAKSPLPIFPLPHHLIQEKTVWLDIFHTLSGIFLAYRERVGRDPSVNLSHGPFSCCQRSHRDPTATTAYLNSSVNEVFLSFLLYLVTAPAI